MVLTKSLLSAEARVKRLGYLVNFLTCQFQVADRGDFPKIKISANNEIVVIIHLIFGGRCENKKGGEEKKGAVCTEGEVAVILAERQESFFPLKPWMLISVPEGQNCRSPNSNPIMGQVNRSLPRRSSQSVSFFYLSSQFLSFHKNDVFFSNFPCPFSKAQRVQSFILHHTTQTSHSISYEDFSYIFYILFTLHRSVIVSLIGLDQVIFPAQIYNPAFSLDKT